MQTGAPFEPLRPPSPSSLGKPRAARSYRRTRKWGRRALILSVGAGALYLADNQLLASGVARLLRTFGLGLFVALDYKLNFRPEPLTGGTIEDLHRRSAERLFDLLRANGGLYLKIGQAIAMQSAVLPPEFQRMFARMFDDAPQAAWADVEKVIRGETLHNRMKMPPGPMTVPVPQKPGIPGESSPPPGTSGEGQPPPPAAGGIASSSNQSTSATAVTGLGDAQR